MNIGKEDFPSELRLVRLMFWPVILFGFAVLGATTDVIRDIDAGKDVNFLAVYYREFASATVILFLAFALMQIDKRWPYSRLGPWRFGGLHLFLSVPFAILHVFTATLIYLIPDMLSGAIPNLVYIAQSIPREYGKDFIVYAMLLSLVMLQQHLINLFRQGVLSSITRHQLQVENREGVSYQNLDEICHLEGARNYVIVHSGGREFIKRTTLQDMEDLLPSDIFVRVHRSHIINKHHICEVKTKDRRDPVLLLTTGKEVPVGRSYKARVISVLKENGQSE